MSRHLLSILVLATLTGCIALPDPADPREYLDPATAATIQVVGRPLVFSHERPELAVHMRDYINLAAAAVDRSGKTDYVLITYFWTTLDAHGRLGDAAAPNVPTAYQDPSVTNDTLTLIADDRRIELRLMNRTPSEVGIGVAVHSPPVRGIVPNVYRTDLATLRFLAAARVITATREPDAVDAWYLLWDDQRASLGAFVRKATGQL